MYFRMNVLRYSSATRLAEAILMAAGKALAVRTAVGDSEGDDG
jgi:hypothetical protein